MDNFLEQEQTAKYLDMARAIGRDVPLIDAHVHASEVIFEQAQHAAAVDPSGIWSATGRPYVPPASGPARIAPIDDTAAKLSGEMRARVSRMAFTRAYEHTGPVVLEQHMALAGLSHVLLLPVAREDNAIGDQMQRLDTLRGGDERFLLAYSLRPGGETQDVGAEIGAAKEAYGITAVKLHPNISNFDVVDNRKWVEQALAACDQLALPVVLHGGRSPIYPDSRRSRNAVLANLSQINWGVTRGAVVLSHFGVYGFSAGEVEAEQAALLDGLLARHDNVMVDTSGLSYDVLKMMLPRVDGARVLYGSDAQYFPMWQSVVLLLHALTENQLPVEASFVRMASENVITHLGLRAEAE